MKELHGEYGIETIFTHTVSLKTEILKKLENELAMNPCGYSVVDWKGQGHHIRQTNTMTNTM